MLRGIVAFAFVTVLWSGTALASRRRSRPFVPPHGHRVGVTFVRGVERSHAQTEATRLEPRVNACLEAARAHHGTHLEAMQTAYVIVHVKRDGHASRVEIAPSRLPATLSACLADPLLDWAQSGRVRKHPMIHLGIRLSQEPVPSSSAP